MNLMICDDQQSELDTMRQIVSEYALAHAALSLSVKCFQNPFDMLAEIDRSGAPDIALLDICMPGILGTEVAREILGKSAEDTDVIFLTTSPDFAVEAFALHAGDYLTKPLEEYIKRESYCINPERSTVLGICKLGNDAGIVGAANLYRLKD